MDPAQTNQKPSSTPPQTPAANIPPPPGTPQNQPEDSTPPPQPQPQSIPQESPQIPKSAPQNVPKAYQDLSNPQAAIPHIPQSPPTTPPLTRQTPPPPPPQEKKPNLTTIAITSLLIILLLLIGATGTSLAAAYGQLPFDQPQLKALGTRLILAMPFLPKTLEQVVTATIAAHQEVSTASFDASLATRSQSLLEFLNTDSFQLQLSGDIDLTDPDKPQSAINLNVAGQFAADLISAEDSFYFNIQKIPSALLAFTGFGEIPEDAGILNQWVSYQADPLDTPAGQALDERPTDNPFDQELEKTLTQLYQTTILPNTTLTTNDHQGQPHHHIQTTLEGQPINDFIQGLLDTAPDDFSAIDTDRILPSDVIKRIELDFYIDRSTYLVSQASLYLRYDNSAIIDQTSQSLEGIVPSLQKEQNEIQITLNLANVGQPVTITFPQDSITVEAYGERVMTAFFSQASSGPYAYQFMSARDTQRRDDGFIVINAIYQYALENDDQLPPTITNTPTELKQLNLQEYLVPTYIAALPWDPSKKPTDPESGYTLHLNAQNRLVFQAQSEVTPDSIIEVTR